MKRALGLSALVLALAVPGSASAQLPDLGGVPQLPDVGGVPQLPGLGGDQGGGRCDNFTPLYAISGKVTQGRTRYIMLRHRSDFRMIEPAVPSAEKPVTVTAKGRTALFRNTSRDQLAVTYRRGQGPVTVSASWVENRTYYDDSGVVQRRRCTQAISRSLSAPRARRAQSRRGGRRDSRPNRAQPRFTG